MGCAEDQEKWGTGPFPPQRPDGRSPPVGWTAGLPSAHPIPSGRGVQLPASPAGSLGYCVLR